MQRFPIVRLEWEIKSPVLRASFRKIKDSEVFAMTCVAHEGGSSG